MASKNLKLFSETNESYTIIDSNEIYKKLIGSFGFSYAKNLMMALEVNGSAEFKLGEKTFIIKKG